MAKPNLTAERLRELVTYDPETGYFYNRIQRSNCKVGARLGTKSADSAILIGIDYRVYRAHRIAWLYVTGEWPRIIDHINGDPSDNAFINLRDGTQAQNMQNQRRAKSNNQNGFLGAKWHNASKSWHASIGVDGKTVSLRYHKSPELAHAAYVEAKRRLHPFGTL